MNSTQIALLVGAWTLTAALSYLIGSIPFAKIIAKAHGVDIEKVGSKNVGGTNVGRSVGKGAGILTMFLDGLKCLIPCLVSFLLARFLAPTSYWIQELSPAIVALCVALGHSFPLFNHFKGGKCVACFAGYVVFFSPLIAIIGCSVFFITFGIKKRVSLASLIAAPITFLSTCIPMALHLAGVTPYGTYNGGAFFGPSCYLHLTYITFIAVFLIVLTIVIRHRANIRRLEKGVEPETHFKKSN